MNSSDPSKKLMGKTVNIGVDGKQGVIRGYDPKSGEWWVVISNSAWYDEDEFEVVE